MTPLGIEPTTLWVKEGDFTITLRANCFLMAQAAQAAQVAQVAQAAPKRPHLGKFFCAPKNCNSFFWII